MNILVVGCGRWGSFLAWYLCSIGHRVSLYGREASPHFAAFQKTGTNGLVTLQKEVVLTNELRWDKADCVVVSISAQSLRTFMSAVPQGALDGKPVVLCMKGLEIGTGRRLSTIVEEYAPRARVAVWVGPGHVQDFVAGIPNRLVIDSPDPDTKEFLVPAFSSSLIRFYYGSDMVGNEIGAAAKNVIGIAAGMLDGKNKTALKGALMSRGTREIARLIKVMGGNEITAYGLSHLGDYQATVFSMFSHNRRYGEAFVRGEAYDELAEGVPTTTALLSLGEKHGVELPICTAVDAVLHRGEEPEQALADLFLRSLKREF